MATLTINIPDAQVQRIIEALVRSRDPEAPDDQLTAANAKAILIDHIKRYVQQYESSKAATEAASSPEPELT